MRTDKHVGRPFKEADWPMMFDLPSENVLATIEASATYQIVQLYDGTVLILSAAQMKRHRDDPTWYVQQGPMHYPDALRYVADVVDGLNGSGGGDRVEQAQADLKIANNYHP